MADYDAATQQYGVIVRYLKAAIEVLPKAECQLLLEFAENLFLMRHDHAADS
jgi:hypothetical protein